MDTTVWDEEQVFFLYFFEMGGTCIVALAMQILVNVAVV